MKKVASTRITRRTSREHMKPATVLSSSDSLVAPVGVSRSRAAPRRAAVAARASTDAAATGPAVGVGNTFRTATDRVTLGTSDLSVAATGAGAWAWGDRSGYWGSDWEGDRAKNLDAYRTLLAGGVDFIDTAEVYGFGKSEELIREFMRDTAADATLCPPLLATKFAPIPFRFRAEDVPNALRASMARMGVRKVALYMQHWPAFGLPGRHRGVQRRVPRGPLPVLRTRFVPRGGRQQLQRRARQARGEEVRGTRRAVRVQPDPVLVGVQNAGDGHRRDGRV